MFFCCEMRKIYPAKITAFTVCHICVSKPVETKHHVPVKMNLNLNKHVVCKLFSKQLIKTGHCCVAINSQHWPRFSFLIMTCRCDIKLLIWPAPCCINAWWLHRLHQDLSSRLPEIHHSRGGALPGILLCHGGKILCPLIISVSLTRPFFVIDILISVKRHISLDADHFSQYFVLSARCFCAAFTLQTSENNLRPP